MRLRRSCRNKQTHIRERMNPNTTRAQIWVRRDYKFCGTVLHAFASVVLAVASVLLRFSACKIHGFCFGGFSGRLVGACFLNVCFSVYFCGFSGRLVGAPPCFVPKTKPVQNRLRTRFCRTKKSFTVQFWDSHELHRVKSWDSHELHV